MSVEWIIVMVILGFILGYTLRKRKQKLVLLQNVTAEPEHTPPNEENVYPLATFRSARCPPVLMTSTDVHPEGNGVFENSLNLKTNGSVVRFQDPKLQRLFGKDNAHPPLLDLPFNENDERA